MSETKEATRARIIATFELYGWRPVSALKAGRMPTSETVVGREADGRILRVINGTAIFCKRDRQEMDRYLCREPREWKDITLPQLVKMHERFLRLCVKESEATHA